MNNNISLLRDISIIAIVLHHSMCVYSGWPPNISIDGTLPDSITIISSYLKLLGLGSFTFISGYLAYSTKRISNYDFMLKKAKRLLLPCFYVAILYWAFFPNQMFDDFPSPVNGTHLWYLPMLFIIMMIVKFVNGSECIYKRFGVLTVTWIIFLLMYKTTSFRTFSECFTYLPIFIIGYEVHKYESRLTSCRTLVLTMGGG